MGEQARDAAGARAELHDGAGVGVVVRVGRGIRTRRDDRQRLGEHARERLRVAPGDEVVELRARGVVLEIQRHGNIASAGAGKASAGSSRDAIASTTSAGRSAR
ncbi:hypothetical protein CMMCAS02_01820 [Clavibacter michiganensis subsp. michiganensis]|nr:hypothetical protein CMMCAS02_01820 [Clavibacter michiganensis subsp. michiganensis]